jgi:hypothetical protein
MSARLVAAFCAAAVAALVTVPVIGASAVRADDDPGVGLTVTVTASPTPTPTPTPHPTSSSSTGTGGSGSGSGSDDPQTPSPSPTAKADPGSGLLSVSGVRAESLLSLNPLSGVLRSQFTVHNDTDTDVDGIARFWLIGPFGNLISEDRGVRVYNLKAGESRTVYGDLPGVGQWTFVTVHFEFTPLTQVHGAKLDPTRRESFVIVFPWLVGVLLIAVGAAVLIVWLVRRASWFAPLRLVELE